MIISLALLWLFSAPILFALAIKMSNGKNVGRILGYMVTTGISGLLFLMSEYFLSLFFLVLPFLINLSIRIIVWSIKVLID